MRTLFWPADSTKPPVEKSVDSLEAFWHYIYRLDKPDEKDWGTTVLEVSPNKDDDGLYLVMTWVAVPD